MMTSSMGCFHLTYTCTTSKNNKGTLRKMCNILRHCADIIHGVKYDSIYTYWHCFIPCLCIQTDSIIIGRDPVYNLQSGLPIIHNPKWLYKVS